MNSSKWDWFEHGWNDQLNIAVWNDTLIDKYHLVQEQVNNFQPVIGYSIWDGPGWFTAMFVALSEKTPKRTEHSNGTQTEIPVHIEWVPELLCAQIHVAIGGDKWGG